MKITVGENIRRLRRERDVTQEQLAEAMNVSTAAVSKWERCESYPDITLLFPLANYFEVSIDGLMGYDAERINAQIEERLDAFLKQYLSGTSAGAEEAKRIITEAYREYPNDCRVMSRYMWFIAGDMADNDPEVLLSHKEEFLGICEKLLEDCCDEGIRLGAWNMRAKILHAEGNTDGALEIYRTKFASWYQTCEQKSEQLFAKDTDDYYLWVKRNMYELFSFAADKTGDGVFLVIAESFLGRMKNDLCYRGGADGEVAAVLEAQLRVLERLSGEIGKNEVLYDAVFAHNKFWAGSNGDLAGHMARLCSSAKEGRRAELLKCQEYAGVLEKYSRGRKDGK